MVLLSSNHLRRSVARTTTGCLESFVLLIDVRQSEVDDFDVIVIIKKQVLRFQVSMADFDFVNVIDA